MTSIYFVRHAKPDFSHKDDRTRPLTEDRECVGKEEILIIEKPYK